MFIDNNNDLFVPDFIKKIIHSINIGISHQFLLYGNINDFFRIGKEYMPLKEVLKLIFANREFVCFYNLALGIYFDDMEKRKLFFEKIVTRASKYYDGIPRDPDISLLYLEKALKHGEDIHRKTAVIIDYLESLAPSQSVTGRSKIDAIAISRWANDLDIAKKKNTVILITKDKANISDDLIISSVGMDVIEIKMPEQTDRLDYLNYLSKKLKMDLKEDEINNISLASGGLCLHHLENIMLQAKAYGKTVDHDLVLEQKIRIINQEYSDIVEVVNPKFGLEYVGGFDYIKNYLKKVAENISLGNSKTVPMGIIIMGPPGTGKTFLIECFAKECGLLVVTAKNLRDKYVGESEKKQERFHSLLKAMAPVIVIIDESEQQEGSRTDSESSQLDNRIRAKNFHFWGDGSNRGKIVRIDITNWPNKIDPAMRRSGRSDAKIPILFPSKDDIFKIIRSITKKHKFIVEDMDQRYWEDRLSGYTPANIEQVLLISHEFAVSEGSKVIRKEHLEKAYNDFRLPRYNQEEIERMTIAALEEASRRSLMPKDAEKILSELRKKYPARPFMTS